MRNEHEGYAIEAALEAGFVFTNDDGTLFSCTDEALLKFGDAARSELIAEIERLRQELNMYRDAASIDVKMEGPVFVGVKGSAFIRAIKFDREFCSVKTDHIKWLGNSDALGEKE